MLDAIVYSHELKILGSVGAIDILENTVKIVDQKHDVHVERLKNVHILNKVGNIDYENVYDHDVLETDSGQLYLVQIASKGMIRIAILDKDLEIVEEGEPFNQDDFEELVPFVKLVGNIYELRDAKPNVDFNIKIVREHDKGEFKYFYVGHDKERGQVDLIKVVYMGHHLLKEENYERKTLSYEEYQELINNKTLVEVQPNELANYVLGVKTFEDEDLLKQHGQAKKKNPFGLNTDGLLDEIDEEDDEDLFEF